MIEAAITVLSVVGIGIGTGIVLDNRTTGSNMADLQAEGSQVVLFFGANSDLTEYLDTEHYRTKKIIPFPSTTSKESKGGDGRGIPDFVTDSPKAVTGEPFQLNCRLFMGRTKINKVQSVLDHLQTARAKEPDPWHSDEYQVAWQAIYEGFFNKKENPWQLAYAKFYGASPKKVAEYRTERRRLAMRDTRPLIPRAPSYKQLALPFGPYVVGNLNQTQPVKKLPKKALVMRKAAGQ